MPQDVGFFVPFPPRISPDAAGARTRNLAWVRAHRLTAGPADEERLMLWDIAGLMARWLPEATGPALDLAVNAVVLTTVLDDQFDSPPYRDPERAARIVAHLADLAQPGSTAVPEGPLARAYAEIVDGIYRDASPEWAQRTFRHLRWYLDASACEVRNRFDRRTPSRQEYFAQRRRSGFVYPMLDLCQKAYGFELPPRAYQDPVTARMMQITADFVDAVNDAHSLEKEEERGQERDNMVHVLLHETACSRAEAIAEVVRMDDALVREFISLEQQAGTDAGTRRLIDCMRSAMRGYVDWSSTTGRYSHIVPAAQPAYSDVMQASAADVGDANATVL